MSSLVEKLWQINLPNIGRKWHDRRTNHIPRRRSLLIQTLHCRQSSTRSLLIQTEFDNNIVNPNPLIKWDFRFRDLKRKWTLWWKNCGKSTYQILGESDTIEELITFRGEDPYWYKLYRVGSLAQDEQLPFIINYASPTIRPIQDLKDFLILE